MTSGQAGFRAGTGAESRGRGCAASRSGAIAASRAAEWAATAADRRRLTFPPPPSAVQASAALHSSTTSSHECRTRWRRTPSSRRASTSLAERPQAWFSAAQAESHPESGCSRSYWRTSGAPLAHGITGSVEPRHRHRLSPIHDPLSARERPGAPRVPGRPGRQATNPVTW